MIMTNIQKIVGVVVVLALCLGTYLLGHNTKDTPGIFGSPGTNPVENYIPIIKYNDGYYSELGMTVTGDTSFSGSNTLGSTTITALKVGQIGTRGTLVLSGTCNLTSDSSIAATSTGTGSCSTPGTVAGDRVFVSLSTTTTKLAAQYSLIGTVAGTDTTTVRLLNLTGTSAVPSATNGLGSSTQYYVYR